MRRITLFFMICTLLILSPISQFSNAKQDNQNLQMEIIKNSSGIQPLQDPLVGQLSRPILVSVENTTGATELINPLRNRNDTLGEGAVHSVEVYNNVTFTYLVINGDENTTLNLHAQVPNLNLTLNVDDVNGSLAFKYLEGSTTYENYTLPYDKENGFIFNATQSLFTVKLNVSAEYIQYFASINSANRETTGSSPLNFLTIDANWKTQSLDEFFIQNEKVNITISALNTTDTDTYGLRFRINEGKSNDKNFTSPSAGALNASLEFADYEIGSVFYFVSYAILNDTVSNQTRRIDNTEIKSVRIEDGRPTISSEIIDRDDKGIFANNTYYTQLKDVSFNFSATVPKGNITMFNLTLGLENVPLVAVGNVSVSGDYLNYTHSFPSDGKYNVTIVAITSKNLEINTTFLIVVDDIDPAILFTTDSENQEITSYDGIVTFSFEYQEENSGIRNIVIDFGDGLQMEVTGDNSVTHTYLFKENTRVFEVEITIVDWAGNSDSVTTIVTLHVPDLDERSAPLTEFFIALVIIFIAIMAYVFREKLPSVFKR